MDLRRELPHLLGTDRRGVLAFPLLDQFLQFVFVAERAGEFVFHGSATEAPRLNVAGGTFMRRPRPGRLLGVPTFPSGTDSALRRHLTPSVWERLSGTSDATGFRFEDAIASGLANPDSRIGVYAGSADSYRAFAPLFDPIVQEYHGPVTHRERIAPEDVPELSPAAQDAVRSTRVRAARNLAAYPLGPAISAAGRDAVEQEAREAMEAFTDDLSGTYLPLPRLAPPEKRRLVDAHWLFKDGDRFLQAAGLTRDWPQNRGIFRSNDRKTLIWVNEEDHLRIIAMEQGGDVRGVLGRFQRTLDALDGLDFARDEALGFIASCPTNLGTGLRASVHVELPGLDKARIEEIAKAHHVQVRGVHGEHTESEGDVWDISNARRLGWTETELVGDMVRGVEALVAAMDP